MARDIRTEEQRLIAQLESLVNGLATEITRLNKELERRDAWMRKHSLRMQQLEARLRAHDLPTNGELDD